MSPRIEALELKLAYLERANQELGEVVYRQQQELDALRATVARLADRLQALAASPADDSAADEVPPHY